METTGYNLFGSAALGLALTIGAAASSNAMVVYDSWTTNAGASGNYIFTIDYDAVDDQFDYNLTVDPWNAEALGVFIDLGDFDISGSVGLTNIVPTGEVSLYATDTTSNNCGSGCNLNGLNPTLESPDGEWEMVFRLGSQGFDSIQTFSFSTNAFGLTDTDSFGTVGIRAQQLCDGTNLLPDGSCGGSDKSTGTGSSTSSSNGGGGTNVPEPGVLALIGVGLLGGLLTRRRRKMAQ